MENATKGLMIAGAILIAIVLIGIGVFLVSQAQGFMDQGGQQFDEMTKTSFNSPFENYSGKRTGSDVRALINRVNSSNLTAASEGTYGEQGIKLILDASGSSTGKEIVVDGTVDGYSSIKATQARNAVNTGKTFYVSLGYDNNTGLIKYIAIAGDNNGEGQGIADAKVEAELQSNS